MNKLETITSKILFPKAAIASLLIGAAVTGALYFMYKRGRVDEINEICGIVADQGETTFKFHYLDGISAIHMEQI